MTTRIVGSYVSPYVRKVLVVLGLKGIDYEIDPIVPFFGDDRFQAASPLRRIPILINLDITISDSTVICEYLDEQRPSPSLMPGTPKQRAEARWLEEYADTRLGDVIIWKLFNERLIAPAVWGRPTDDAVIQEVLDKDLPDVMAYLEAQAPEQGFRFGEQVTIADIAVAAFFRNAAFVRWKPDPERWPKASGWIARTLALEAFTRLEPYERLCAKTPIPQQRAALIAAGAPVSAESFGTDRPRKGVLPT